MMTTVLPSRRESFIVGPRAVVRRMRTGNREPLTLQWGRRFASVATMGVRAGRGMRGLRLYLAPPVFAALRLRPGMRVDVDVDLRSRRLRLGPVFGIFACRRPGDPTLYGQDSFFRALTIVARARGVTAYVFSPEDVDWEEGTVHGLVPAPSAAGWRRRSFPLPDVVYNRVQNRSLERLPEVQHALRRFQRMDGVALFNRGFLDKWAVHTLLRRHPEVGDHIPRTELLPLDDRVGAAALQSLAAGGGRLFIKPVDGSLGQDIAVVRRDADAAYAYTYYAEGGPISGTSFATAADLWEDLRLRLSPRRFVVQQGLDLVTYRGRPFDVRIIAQRGAGGRWRAVSMFARAAAPGELRTNVEVGGRVLPWRVALRGAFGRRARAVAGDMLRTARNVAEGLAAMQGSIIGELAIDLGIDKTGKAWLIELNAKPVRRIGPRVSLRRPPPSLTALLDFAKTLTRTG